MKLTWWPFIEISILTGKTNFKELMQKILRLDEIWLYFDNLNQDNSLWLIAEWCIIRDGKFCSLDVQQISNELMYVNISFIYHTWINGETYWVDREYIKSTLPKILSTLDWSLDIYAYLVDKENDILNYFSTDECWPHNDYTMSNFNKEKFTLNSWAYFKAINIC